MGLAPPPANLPSLNALRAFEAAARLESFTLAAAELLVSPAGIAHHVKSVEAWTEQSLFDRHPHGVRLNSAGQAALPLLTEGFSALGRATVELRAQRTHPSTLRIAALPAIAQIWLAPRVSEISEVLPDVSISVHAMETPPDLKTEPYDMTIFFSEDTADRSVDELCPVAAPAVAEQLKKVTDLRDHCLLHDTHWAGDWQTWLDGSSTTDVGTTSGTSYTLYAMAIDAAVRGEGVLMGRTSLITHLLSDGRLVEPFDRRVPTQDALTIRFREPIDRALRPLARWAELR